MTSLSSVRRVGIITNPTKPNAAQLRDALRQWLLRRNVQVLDEAEIPIEKIIAGSDLCVCLGGDGTILHLAGRMV
ncbi:MAG: hypothetical protein HY588_04210, partial [Candidatus Omnitrophica bacterium]|nr:hypothetical protein [Candidatus Omnitrophota bacterium]